MRATPQASSQTSAPAPLLVHTVGHSDHPLSTFVALLRQHGIACVVDVRSQPYSQWTPQFNREALATALSAAGLHYAYLGDKLGGRPADPSLYPAGQEQPDYGLLAQTAAYRQGIEALLLLARQQSVAVMCSEGDFHHCHRHLLITQTLLERHVRVLHIQPDGRSVAAEVIPRQLTLFG